jgi:hypothetical protein
MSKVELSPCEHAETTTLLWLYGEGDDGHAEHVAGCQACTRVVEVHSETIARIGQARLADPVGELHPANRPFPAWWMGMVAAAAVLVLAAGGVAVVWSTFPQGEPDKTQLVESRGPTPADDTPAPTEAPQVAEVPRVPAPVPPESAIDRPAPPGLRESPPAGSIDRIARVTPVDLPETPPRVRAESFGVPAAAERFEADVGGLFDDLDDLEANLALL